jgi:hypothetical protein
LDTFSSLFPASYHLPPFHVLPFMLHYLSTFDASSDIRGNFVYASIFKSFQRFSFLLAATSFGVTRSITPPYSQGWFIARYYTLIVRGLPSSVQSF